MHLPYIPKRFYKTPGSTLAYKWNWTRWLAKRQDTISTAQVTVAGLSATNVSHANGIVTASISGGVVGSRYTATCRITTVGSSPAGVLIEERSIVLTIKAM